MIRKKILVTGALGQLGNELKDLSVEHPEYEFLFTDLPELDISDANAVSDFFSLHKPEAVINCAAFTAVDKAETEREAAFRINATAPGILAEAANAHSALLLHVSTDYVFDGKGHLPLNENDTVNPQSVYGQSKLAGEEEVKRRTKKAVIIRTSWLYSAYGHNFVKTMLRKGKEQGPINVVSDQIGSPTYARDLAKALLAILPHAPEISGIELYHFANLGVASWYDLTKAIMDFAGYTCKVNPIPTSGYPLPAPRPYYSVLDTSGIRERFSLEIPYWRDSLAHCLARLQNS